MKRKLLSYIMILGLSGAAINPLFAEENQKIDPYASVWKDKNAKEWGDTPPFIRVLVETIAEKSKKTDVISPFSVVWLKQVISDRKAYNLSDSDVKWIEDTLVRTAKEKKTEWEPQSAVESKTIVAENKTSIPDDNTKNSIAKTDNTAISKNPEDKQENEKLVSVSSKEDSENNKVAVSIPANQNMVKEKAEIAKEDTKALNLADENKKLAKDEINKEKSTEKNKIIAENVKPQVVTVNKDMADTNNSKKIISNTVSNVDSDQKVWIVEVLKQLSAIVLILAAVLAFTTRNSKYRIINK